MTIPDAANGAPMGPPPPDLPDYAAQAWLPQPSVTPAEIETQALRLLAADYLLLLRASARTSPRLGVTGMVEVYRRIAADHHPDRGASDEDRWTLTPKGEAVLAGGE